MRRDYLMGLAKAGLVFVLFGAALAWVFQDVTLATRGDGLPESVALAEAEAEAELTPITAKPKEEAAAPSPGVHIVAAAPPVPPTPLSVPGPPEPSPVAFPEPVPAPPAAAVTLPERDPSPPSVQPPTLPMPPVAANTTEVPLPPPPIAESPRPERLPAESAPAPAVVVPVTTTSWSTSEPAAQAKGLPVTGTHGCTLEERHLTLPSSVRELMGEPDVLFLTPGPDQCLWVGTAADLARLMESKSCSGADEAKARAFRRVHFAQTERCAVKNGQCHLPERLVQYAGLKCDAVLIGAGDHFELWDAQRWQEYLRENAAGAENKN